MTTRRSLILQAMAGAMLAAAGPALAQARTVGAIRVDTARLAAQGWGPRSQEIKRDLERQLATTLAPMIRRGGPVLTVTVKGVWLASWAGGGGGGKPGAGGASMDNFDADYVLTGPRGEVLGQWTILSTIGSDSGGAWYRPDVDQRRVAALIENNALWIRRYLGG
ncbi:MAG: hypothetical protein Q8R85_19920 [Bosea sp. (in: a-proteobacteria)]|jgi:hypothetical protein|uniref:hypothetical protein n=1 Tax=Bosea sp. (in: a-proteobacteria) TaxID=1871050 RepID=UPI002735EA9D|nr:hypothetical protein [Bosea sp. (in: a-proteobacteria)]MDP3603436.1 hypothetical protein [Bosea sp. (in: a-proteobacteria)]WRH60146.1 MAG: hypothetical protein RSE11_10380 [Bosea sp. (in: a-proteobacteria)]